MKDRTLEVLPSGTRQQAKKRLPLAALKLIAAPLLILALFVVFFIPETTLREAGINGVNGWYILITSIIGGVTVIAMICLLIEKITAIARHRTDRK